MKNRSTILLIAIVSLLAFSTAAFAWGPGSGKGCCKRWGQGSGSGMGMGMAVQWQDLTDEQQAQLGDRHQKFIDETAEVRAALVSKYENIRILMETSTPDREKLISLITEIGDLKKQVMEKRIDFALDAKKIAPELDLPFMESGGRGQCYGMGMGGFGKRGCQKMNAGCYGSAGCQQMVVGCPRQAQTN